MSKQIDGAKVLDINKMGMSIRYCMRLSWVTSKLYTVIELLFSALLTILPFATLYMSKTLVDHLVNQNREIIVALKCVIEIALVNTLSAILRQVLGYIQTIHSELIQFHIQEGIIKKSMTMDMEFFDSPDYLDAMQAVKNNATGLPNSTWNILSCINCSISAIYAFFLLSNVSVIAASLIGMLSIPTGIINRNFAKRIYECRLTLIHESRMLGYLQSITGHKVFASDIRLFDLSEDFVRRYRRCSRKIFEKEKRELQKGVFARSAMGIVPQLFVCLMLLGLVHSISEGSMTAGDYTLYSGLLGTLTTSTSQFVGAAIRIYEDKLRVLTIKEFEDRVNSVEDIGTRDLSSINNIEFRNVSFRYPSSTKETIKNLSFKVHAGEKICIVGVNGTGKSTLIKLLLRFYDVSSGEILINGRNIKEYSLVNLRKCFSTMFQEYDKYAFSLRDNIVLSDLQKTNYADADVYEALSNAGAENILNKVDCNLDVCLSKLFDPTGIELSGGEKQKIGLARAIYRNCSVMILDEPSAALDPFAENQLLKCMMNSTIGKIVVFTAHRFSTISIADRILVLEDGVLVESGSHEELLRKQGKYADLYMAQAQKFSSH